MPDTRSIVIFNIGWMNRYQGVTARDPLVGGGRVPSHTGHGDEEFNFQHFANTMYGFAEAGYEPVLKRIAIERLGARPTAPSVSGILVIWVARHPAHRRTLVVGWYEHAKVHRQRQPAPPSSGRMMPGGHRAGYFAEAKKEDCLLIPHDKRDFQILRAAEVRAAAIAPQGLKCAGGIGQSNVYYAQDWYGNHRKPELFAYIARWEHHRLQSVQL